ncbi:zinc finger CCCH domain-containing protein 17 [Dorcoceras hygrometricum]|uniref:Zinc finger CCCH domain-containing protein 17 n=1 Tax=Dorcoceras hygrometricum TaxID=472368 RepID=A0A2Z7D1A8_9LAMI|nr:zinc finger CCCH domain-containing protein 17 [Dorcoceras hygrometricum]
MAGPSLAEEEAVKRNTDCVYFLASPLTCKKGSECEYRHSDIARVNPRDCWYWLHSNCLNPKCGFRHPPLDGLLSTQTPTPTARSATQSQNVTASTSHVPNTSTKQTVPCVFFQKGLCVKGDWCPFLHTPNSVNNKASVLPGAASAVEPASFKKALGGHKKFEHGKKVSHIDTVNSVKLPQKVKAAVETEPAPLRNEFSMNKRIAHTSEVNDIPGYSVSNGNPFSWSERPHLSGELGAMNKDVEEVSREPSPGFDVLVDDERRDSEYYPGKDHYRIPGEHEVGDEFDIDRATNFNMIADIDGERFQEHHGYEFNELRKGRHAFEQHRASSERVIGGSYFDRKPYARADSISQVEELDLRHRLNKRKKANGLRSVISHEHARERHVEERRYPGSNRDEQYVPLHENSVLSSHLRGRIRVPSRSSPPNERDAIPLGPDHGRLSPARTNFSSHQGRVRDRIKGRLEEDFHNGGKNHRGLHFRNDMIADNVTDFMGPKSLAELKNQKNAQPSGQHVANQQSLGKRKHLALDGNHQVSIQQTGNDLSFDGPMPLEEILKRKRGETIGKSSIKKSSDSDGIIEDNNEKEVNGMATISFSADFVSSTPDNKTKAPVESNKDVYKPVSVDKTEGNSSTWQPVSSSIEAGNDINAGDGVYQDGESDDEQVGGESFDLYDGENGDVDGEYLEDEDDDFAKKMGVMYS